MAVATLSSGLAGALGSHQYLSWEHVSGSVESISSPPSPPFRGSCLGERCTAVAVCSQTCPEVVSAKHGIVEEGACGSRRSLEQGEGRKNRPKVRVGERPNTLPDSSQSSDMDENRRGPFFTTEPLFSSRGKEKAPPRGGERCKTAATRARRQRWGLRGHRQAGRRRRLAQGTASRQGAGLGGAPAMRDPRLAWARSIAITGTVQRWRGATWWTALLAVGMAEGSRLVPWRPPVRKRCRLPDAFVAAWAGPERPSAFGRPSWRSGVARWLQHCRMLATKGGAARGAPKAQVTLRGARAARRSNNDTMPRASSQRPVATEKRQLATSSRDWRAPALKGHAERGPRRRKGSRGAIPSAVMAARMPSAAPPGGVAAARRSRAGGAQRGGLAPRRGVRRREDDPQRHGGVDLVGDGAPRRGYCARACARA